MHTNASHTPLAKEVVQIQQGLREATLMDATPALAVQPAAYLFDKSALDMINSLKQQAYGPCRALYGPDRTRFYDIHISYSKARGTVRVRLVYTQHNKVKSLREVISDDPIKALQEMVDRLCEDLEAVYAENDIGSELDGQQGYTDKCGNWVTIPLWKAGRVDAEDTTRQGDTFVPGKVPRGSRGGKRVRVEEKLVMAVESAVLDYGAA